MNKLDEALKLHLRELENFYISNLQSKMPRHELSNTEIDKLEAAFDGDAATPIGRGRPLVHRSRNERTFQSFQVFVFVTGELRTFRLRHGVKRIPDTVQNALIDFAKRMYPLAHNKKLREHLRKNQRLLPHYDEPTCFELVRYEYENGEVANVIVAGPANGRI